MRSEQLDEIDLAIKLHKHCQRYLYNQNKKRAAMKADIPEEKYDYKILR